MEITVQYFDGCPNWRTTDRDLRTVAAGMGIEAVIHHQLIATPEAAVANRFRGSPTVLIDGIDPFADEAAPFGLSCRVYVTEAGLAGTPTPQMLERALGASAAGSG